MTVPPPAHPAIDETLWREEVQGRFGNQATGITIAVLLAILALALAGWQLLDGDGDGRSGAAAADRIGLLEERVQALEDRVSALEQQAP